jgi:hypothetical protein
LGGLHYLALTEGFDPWADVCSLLGERTEWFRSFVAEQAVQTNEVQRSWGLLPAFLSLGERTLDLIELGPSAGLNLLWDRYRYRYRAGAWGPADAPVVLEGEERSPVPAGLLQARPEVRRRRGIDLNPVDVTTDQGAGLLECFVWADQTERLERLRRAVEVLRGDPPELIRGDYVELLRALLEERRDDALTVVFQTASMVYLASERHGAVYEVLEQAGREAPLAWLTYEDESALELRVWPHGQRRVARMDFHGAWLEWLA